VLSAGEFFRIVVVELKDDQTAEYGVTSNTPVFIKDYLSMHNIQYPFDAKELKDGFRYGWQVQKLANGIVINKTESWEFVLRKEEPPKDIKYVALTKTLDANFYTAVNGKVYFKFIEEYNTIAKLSAFLKSESGPEIRVVFAKDEESLKGTNIRSKGDNRFVLDLDKQQIKPGYHILKVRNEKRETFYLKIYLPK
jgi:hypothetical protein